MPPRLSNRYLDRDHPENRTKAGKTRRIFARRARNSPGLLRSQGLPATTCGPSFEGRFGGVIAVPLSAGERWLFVPLIPAQAGIQFWVPAGVYPRGRGRAERGQTSLVLAALSYFLIQRCEPTGPARSGRPDDKLREPRRMQASAPEQHPNEIGLRSYFDFPRSSRRQPT